MNLKHNFHYRTILSTANEDNVINYLLFGFYNHQEVTYYKELYLDLLHNRCDITSKWGFSTDNFIMLSDSSKLNDINYVKSKFGKYINTSNNIGKNYLRGGKDKYPCFAIPNGKIFNTGGHDTFESSLKCLIESMNRPKKLVLIREIIKL